MMRNLESTHGLVYSGQLLQILVEKGMPRMMPTRRAGKCHERVGIEQVSVIVLPLTLASRNTWMRGARAHVRLAAPASLCDAIFDRVFGAHPPARNLWRVRRESIKKKQTAYPARVGTLFCLV